VTSYAKARRSNGVPFFDLTAINGRIRKDLDLAWESVLAHGRFIDGPEVEQFEREFADYCGVKECVGVGNGTDALELIMMALGIGKGDEVIIPTNTFIATAEAVCAVGARPRFVDVRPDSLLMDFDAVDAAINCSTAAIVSVHMYGQMIEPERILEMGRKRGLVVIEDAAQAHGASFAGRRSGSVGIAAAFSFYPSKNLGALSDAGAVVSSDPGLISKVRSLANHGRAKHDRNRHDLRGRNSRMDSLQAAVLSVKLRLLDRDNGLRAQVMERYQMGLPSAFKPVSVDPRAASVYHLAVVQVSNRDKVITALTRAGIGFGVHYPLPCHLQPAFSKFRRHMPVAEYAAQRILSLPMSPILSKAQTSAVCGTLQRIAMVERLGE
jgi:dTDP-4-amino-4,6-dideoxygalactose transaminase